MTPTLKVRLFGAPRIFLNDSPVQDFVTRKALALFIYVVLNRHAQQRDKVSALLWRDVAEKHAQNSLRRVLSNLRQLVGAYLWIDRQSIAFDEQQPFWVDVESFRAVLGALPAVPPQPQARMATLDVVSIEAALALYEHEFLDGFYVDDAPTFDEWVLLQREELRELALRGFAYLTTYYQGQNNFVAALVAIQRWLAIEPWSETAHYQRISLLAQSGQRTEALAQYEACRTMLADEFGIAPSATMLALYEQIRSQDFAGPVVEVVTRSEPSSQSTVSVPVAAPAAGVAPAVAQAAPPPTSVVASPRNPSVYWGDMPRPSFFAGRQPELQQLQRWLLEEGCSLVTILGVGGTGKTTLAATLTRKLAAMTTADDQVALRDAAAANVSEPRLPHTLARPFTHILWRSLLNAPPLESTLRLWLSELSGHQLTSLPADLDEQLNLLFGYLRQERCLLIIDNLESILRAEDAAGHYLPGYETYSLLVQRLGEIEHQSCLLLTSRELPLGVARLERSYPVVRTLRLEGLPTGTGVELLRTAGLQADLASMQQLVQRYSGNPLALRLVAETVVDDYDGDIKHFLQHETLIFEDVRLVLDQQFSRLSSLEQEVLFWLTVERAPASMSQLAHNFVQPPPHRALLEAVRSLYRRSLIERASPEAQGGVEGEALFSLQNVVLEYSTERLCDLIYTELVTGQLDHCLRHALVKAQATDYVRDTQRRLILQPLAQRLLETWGRPHMADKLKQLVDRLRTHYTTQAGYGAATLLHLAFQLTIKPEGWDFTDLPIWQADLRQGHLPVTNFTGAHFVQSAFFEKFDAILTVAISGDGTLFAASGANSHVHLWRASDGELLRVCRGRGRWVWALAFSPQRDLLASGGSDGIVRLWEIADLHRDELATSESSPLHHSLPGHTDAIFSLAFRPDGRWLASASADHTIRLWDVVDKKPLQTLTGHTATVYAVAFSPDGDYLVSASRDQTVRLWWAATGACLQLLEGHRTQVAALSFSQDGRWLVTADTDGTILVWQVQMGENDTASSIHVQHTLISDTTELAVLVLSPDGATIATNGPDATIRLWSRTTGTLLQTFYGHTESVQALAFHPNGNLLISGSWDQSVRFWEVATGHLLHTRQGYTNAVYDLALSPDGQTLISGNADGALCLHQLSMSHVGRPQAGHSGAVQSVTFHPAGKLLASGGSDHAVRLWQVNDFRLVERKTLYGHRGSLLYVTFSPDGHLLATSSVDQTVRLWDHTSGDCRLVFRMANRTINALVFSRDGQFLIAGSSDGHLYHWSLAVAYAQGDGNVITICDEEPFATIPGGCSTLAISSDGSLLAGAGPDHMIGVWRVADGQKLLAFETPINSTVYAVAFRPNQAAHTPQLVSGSGTGAICLWHIDLVHGQHQLQYVCNEHKGSVRSLQFMPDGQILLSGGADETIRRWDVETGTCTATYLLQQPYADMRITNATGLTAAQRAACKALGAIDETSSVTQI